MIQGRWLYVETGAETRVCRWIIICWNFIRSLSERLRSAILSTRHAHTRLMWTSARTSNKRYGSIDLHVQLLLHNMTAASNTHTQPSIHACINNIEIQLSLTDHISAGAGNFWLSNRRSFSVFRCNCIVISYRFWDVSGRDLGDSSSAATLTVDKSGWRRHSRRYLVIMMMMLVVTSSAFHSTDYFADSKHMGIFNGARMLTLRYV